MIPELEDGVLPDGIHTCTLQEVIERFGRFERSDRRLRLTEALIRYVEEVRSLNIGTAIIIDGSYVTMKAEPNDIDLILVLREDSEPKQELTPAEYNMESTRMMKRLYGFDVHAFTPDNPAYAEYLEFFSNVRPDDPAIRTRRERKGMLWIHI